jgi:DNA-binding SARP family transcriptional activator
VSLRTALDANRCTQFAQVLTRLACKRRTGGVGARLVLLGALRLYRKDAPLALPMTAQRLLAYIALQRRPVTRLAVAGQLWPDTSEQRAAANLRSALWRLHRVAGDVVRARGARLELSPAVSLDVGRIGEVAQAVVSGTGSPTGDEIEELCEAGDVLPDWYDEWVTPERERFRQLRLHALERLCQRLTDERRFPQALEVGLAALRAEPLRETAHRAMIGVHLAEGNVGEALRQYNHCKRQMAQALGMQPSRETAQLLEHGVAARRRVGQRGTTAVTS